MGIVPDELEHYGKHIAKLPLSLMGAPKGKLILVTAITATKAGIGKTTVSIGLALGLNRIGKKAVVALREPSLGPLLRHEGAEQQAAATHRCCQWSASTCTSRAISTPSPLPTT